MITEESILQNLNEPQAEAVRHTEGPVLILAGAGSGKTRTIVHRIAYLIHVKKVRARKIVAVTFTNKAALELKERVYDVAGQSASECLIRTYHSLGLFLLRKLAHYVNYPSNFTIWDESDQMGAINAVVPKVTEEKLNRNELKYLAQSINSYKDSMISPDELPDKIDLDAIDLGHIMQEVYHLYEQKKKDSLAVDFADLLYIPVRILQNNPDALAGLTARYEYFLVDEYQDTNHAQYLMIKLLSSVKKNLCVVGDDDQAIYTWRGADINNILDFARDYKEAKVVKLEENYRSTQPVLDLANAVISNNKNRMDKSLWTQKKEGKNARLLVFSSDRDEAEEIGAIVESLREGVDASEIAVLYRTNSQSRLIEEALLKRKIPYRVFGGPSFFNRKEIKDVLSYLRLAANPFDEVSFFRMINTPNRGIGEKTLQKILVAKDEMTGKERTFFDYLTLIKRHDELPVSAKVKENLKALSLWMEEFRIKANQKTDLGLLLEDVLDRSGLRDFLEEEDRLLGTSRMDNIAELKNSMMRYGISAEGTDLQGYLQDISLFTNTKDQEFDEKAINLMTIHNAKGLEFDSVILAGLDENIFPHYLTLEQNDNNEEERRLFYVAITRARRNLYLTRAQNRFHGGYPQQMKPSVFIGEMPSGMYETINRGRASDPVRSYQAPKPKIPPKGNFSNQINYEKAVSGKGAGSFRSGDRVRHPSFGTGKVFRVEGSGDACKVHIYFSDGKSRKFLQKYAPLEKA